MTQGGGEADLLRLLRGREERAWLQGFLLTRVSAVAQISLNLPGYPKRMPGDRAAIARGLALFLAELGEHPGICVTVENAAGPAVLVELSGTDAVRSKRAAVCIEDSAAWCRVLDIDIITEEGALSRRDLGLAARSCFLCADDAKICARLGRHDIGALRTEAASRVAECL